MELAHIVIIAFTAGVIILFILDLFTERNLKSQIVSLGAMGTFVGILLGLQDFNVDELE
ncbi:hypothetical protein MNB_SV-13-1998 [hydrothermal vent metagenome]|uniref:Uncharacterized protein n=1 Tax=hydrothermal vent metagenome TaxID=652676 RepID=A0A1W1CX56_9ZZZZ